MTGAGATFPAPIYAKWADAYNKATGDQHQLPVGRLRRRHQADHAPRPSTSAPPTCRSTDDELAKDGLIQFPTVIGGVVPVVNIKGIAPGQIKLTGQVLGDIYLGKITKWNDPALDRAEPGRAAARRGDRRRCTAPTARAPASSSPNYLSKVNADWKAKVGEGTAVNWPTGAGGKGNEGVAAFVQRLPNSIGYVEYAYAKQNKMTYTLLKNKDGNFVAAGRRQLQGRRRRRRLDQDASTRC